MVDKNELKRFIVNNMRDNYYNIFRELEKYKNELTESDFVSVYLDVCFSTSFYHNQYNLVNIATYYNLNGSFYHFSSETMKQHICSYNPTEEQLAAFINNNKVDYFLKKHFIENRKDLFNQSSVYEIVLFATKYKNLFNNDLSHCLSIIKKISGIKEINCGNKPSVFHLLVEKKGPFQYGSVNDSFNTNDGIRYIAELVKLGLDVNKADNSGKTPLQLAIEKGEKQFIVSLIKYKPKTNDILDGRSLMNYLNRISGYNDNVLNYFFKNISQESLESYGEKDYKATEILRFKLSEKIIRELVKKIMHIKNNKGDSGSVVSIRERLLTFKHCRAIFFEEESLSIERKIQKMSFNAKSSEKKARSARL